jgi:hypothetical protein
VLKSFIHALREGLNKKIKKLLAISTAINTSQNDPNALKHEINQHKYFLNCDPYPPSHLAEYLTMTSIFNAINFLEFNV